MRTIPLPWTTVCVAGTTVVAIPATGWGKGPDFGKLRATFEARGFTGNITVALGYQTANAENSPDAAVALTSYFDTENLYYGSSFTDVTANTLPKQLVRLVWMVKLSSGSSLGTVRVGGSVDNVPPT